MEAYDIELKRDNDYVIEATIRDGFLLKIKSKWWSESVKNLMHLGH